MAGGFPKTGRRLMIWRCCGGRCRPCRARNHRADTRRAFPLLRPLRHTLAGLFIPVMLFLPYSQLPALLMDNLTLATAAESKSMILPDGSRIFSAVTARRILPMNRHTAAFPGARYRLFQVKSNPWRPFVIRADGREITVVGTEFDVSRRGTEVAVSVANGIVALRDAPDENRCICAPGIKPSAPHRIGTAAQPYPAGTGGEWRNGQITLTDTPLRDVVARLAPYSNHPVSLAANVMDLTVSGRVTLSETDAFYGIAAAVTG